MRIVDEQGLVAEAIACEGKPLSHLVEEAITKANGLPYQTAATLESMINKMEPVGV